MSEYDIREVFRREGLCGADLEAAVLAYKVANNLRLDTVVDAETMARRAELFRRVFGPERLASRSRTAR